MGDGFGVLQAPQISAPLPCSATVCFSVCACVGSQYKQVKENGSRHSGQGTEEKKKKPSNLLLLLRIHSCKMKKIQNIILR